MDGRCFAPFDYVALGHIQQAAADGAGKCVVCGSAAGYSFSECGHEKSINVVELLEKQGQGLNLTWEVRDGILNHRTSGSPATLEGHVVRLSDKIAYINHDIDDAIRAKLFTEEDLPSEYTDILGHSVRERLNTMIHDLIYQSLDRPEIAMSPGMEAAMHACGGGCLKTYTGERRPGRRRAEPAAGSQPLSLVYGSSGPASAGISGSDGDQKRRAFENCVRLCCRDDGRVCH